MTRNVHFIPECVSISHELACYPNVTILVFCLMWKFRGVHALRNWSQNTRYFIFFYWLCVD